MVRAILPVAGGSAVHDTRVDGAHGVVTQAEARDGADAHVVHHHVRARRQFQEKPSSLGPLEIHGDRALVAVQGQEKGAHARMARHTVGTDQVTIQRLHLDHLGAVVAQDLRRIGAEDDSREVQDANAVKRSVCG